MYEFAAILKFKPLKLYTTQDFLKFIEKNFYLVLGESIK